MKLLKEMKKSTIEFGDDEKLKGKKREIPFEKDDVLPNIVDKGLVMKANCDINDDWVFDFVHSYHICRDKSLFSRVMACEDEMVTLPSGEKVVIETIGKVHLKMHNGLVRKLRDMRYMPKMMRNLISLRRLEKIGCTMKT